MRTLALRSRASRIDYERIRRSPIERGNKGQLDTWLRWFLGIALPDTPVCADHESPLDIFSDVYFNDHNVALILGPRGGGKTMMAALDSHLRSRYDPHYDAKIIGGSLEQSKQVKENIDSIVIGGGGEHGRDEDVIRRVTEKKIVYVNGPEVSFLPASNKAARGPHIPGLKIDEVDEIPRSVLESAVGMAQGNLKKGLKTSILMTSTWHNDGGLMGEMIQNAKERRYPFHQYCVFEVLERCPTRRSGKHLQKCPQCPIVRWCHEDRDSRPGWEPKAKRSNGHYPIETLIQKCLILGEGVIKADYLCRGPKSEGIWFVNFDERENVLPDRPADAWAGIYHPEYPLYVSIDYGVCTGMVAFQVRRRVDGRNVVEDVHVVGEYYHESRSAQEDAGAIAREVLLITKGVDINDRSKVLVTMDLSGKASNPVGPTGVGEYGRGGIRNIAFWPSMSGRKRESLELVNSFVKDGSGARHLFINPRCKRTIAAFKNYSRKKQNDTYIPDKPADPQHPFEDMIDALAGGLLELYPNGRGARPSGVSVPMRRLA
jgi:hypothetical protein